MCLGVPPTRDSATHPQSRKRGTWRDAQAWGIASRTLPKPQVFLQAYTVS